MSASDEQKAAAERAKRASAPGHEVTIRMIGQGVSVKCSCGYEEIAFTVMGAYKQRREHIAAQRREETR